MLVIPLVWQREGMNECGFTLLSIQQLRSYHDEIETWKSEEIPFSSQTVPRWSFGCRRTIDNHRQHRTFI